MQPMSKVKLVGLDFGTTTSSAVIASARLVRNAVTGQTELDEVRECYRSEMVFTPLHGDAIDEQRIAAYLDAWLAAGDVRPDEVFGGGALLTGLTAQRDNAAALVRLVRGRLGDALVTTADDPCLESWLAFLGGCAGLSRAHPDRLVLNLDVGGGTTNLALGRAAEVLRTGCLFVGARHVQVEPGGYRIVRLSRYARALFAHLGIRTDVGDTFAAGEVEAVLDFYLSLLEAAVAGTEGPFQTEVGRLHQQVAFRPPPEARAPILTFSGGVGELVYAHLGGAPWPPTTAFGDLGIDLARRIVASPLFGPALRTHRPASAGRATVYGLLRHGTEISGSTLFLPRPEVLPLADLPVLGRIAATATDEAVRAVLELACRSPRGACVRVEPTGSAAASVRALGERIARALRVQCYPPDRPLVLLLRENLGKVLGHYATEWGALPVELVVIDEVPLRDARFVQIGRPREQVVPVSFYGLHELGEPPCVS
jgi:ethanolamine utilization protein EutA